MQQFITFAFRNFTKTAAPGTVRVPMSVLSVGSEWFFIRAQVCSILQSARSGLG
eukprot:SAG11_NODE_27563_length_331_cov_0.887931_1_plen_53_part_01